MPLPEPRAVGKTLHKCPYRPFSGVLLNFPATLRHRPKATQSPYFVEPSEVFRPLPGSSGFLQI